MARSKSGAMHTNIVDDIIRRLNVRNRVGKGFPIQKSEINSLCQHSSDIFLQQPSLLELDGPVKIVGDIHGQYSELLRIFDYGGLPPESNYLFLGDYVDRGSQGLETMCLLLAYKIKYPDNIFLLRGNHETAQISMIYGFYDECLRRCSRGVWKTFVNCFNCLPFAATVEDKIFCVHGGLSKDLRSFDQIRNIKRPCDVPEDGLLCDLVWADPATGQDADWRFNDVRGTSVTFSSTVVSRFMDAHNLELIIRAHEVHMTRMRSMLKIRYL